MVKAYVRLVTVILVLGNAFGKHIAFFTPTGSYSHRVSMWPLVEKLVERGHHVTFISAYPPKNPLENVTELVPKKMADYVHGVMQGGALDVTNRISGNMQAAYDHLPGMGLLSCETFLDSEETINWLKSEPKIDLFVVDWCISECILGLSYKLKAPFVFYAPTVMIANLYEIFGFVPDTSGIPDFEQHYSPPFTFWERAVTAIQPLVWEYKMINYYEDLGKMIREKMNIPDLPPMGEYVRNASLMLWSEFVIEGYPHTLPPNWIIVGGMHCKETADPLPKDLEEIVRKGKDGFIYMSLGSAVVPGNLPKAYQDVFFNAIRAFPNIQFLWKWHGKMPVKEDLPKNLHIANWFPQQDLLAREDILAFVSQAGRPSSQEAIFHGVPIIALPVFEDQDYTAERVRDMGGGIALEIATLKQSEFEDAIRNITTDPKYQASMKRLSKIFKDRPMKPAELGVYWLEYAMRWNGNLNHFRSPSFYLNWFQRRHLDVYAVIFLAIIFTISIIIHIFIYCIGKLIFDKNCSQSTPKKSKKVKRKDA